MSTGVHVGPSGTELRYCFIIKPTVGRGSQGVFEVDDEAGLSRATRQLQQGIAAAATLGEASGGRSCSPGGATWRPRTVCSQ